VTGPARNPGRTAFRALLPPLLPYPHMPSPRTHAHTRARSLSLSFPLSCKHFVTLLRRGSLKMAVNVRPRKVPFQLSLPPLPLPPNRGPPHAAPTPVGTFPAQVLRRSAIFTPRASWTLADSVPNCSRLKRIRDSQ
jgi:hypothetical protein